MYSKMNRALDRNYLIIKRIFDFILGGIGFVIFFPLYITIAYLVYIEDGGSIFFEQERVGRGGKIFKLLKFRSMKVAQGRYLDLDLLEADPRVTKIGKLLRITAMDELPQVINILKGEMSFVGPKPLPYIIDDDEKVRYNTLSDVYGYSTRIKMTPGLTGISQIYAKKTISRRSKFRYDNLYSKNRNLCLDLKLIFLSLFITLRAKWETAERKI